MTYNPGREWLRHTAQEVIDFGDATSVLQAIGCTQVTMDWGSRLLAYLDVNYDRRVRKIAEPGDTNGWTFGHIIDVEMKRKRNDWLWKKT